MVYFIIGLVVYIIFVIVNADEETEEGFLGLGDITHTHRELTPKDIRRSLIWPFLFLVCITKELAGGVNELLRLFLLIFGLYYNKTKLYKKIDNWALF
jgi:hypothetical protein